MLIHRIPIIRNNNVGLSLSGSNDIYFKEGNFEAELLSEEIRQKSGIDSKKGSLEGTWSWVYHLTESAYPKTATEALSENIYPFLVDLLSGETIIESIRNNPPIKRGVNIDEGKIVLKPIAETFDLEFTRLEL